MSGNWYRKGFRAVDDSMKEEIVARILAVWKANPQLRFMQLLGNVFRGDAYYVEDYDVAEILEEEYSRTQDQDQITEELLAEDFSQE